MVFFNYATKEITAKIVYYGPGLSGKTTNLQNIYHNLPTGDKGKMISLATSDDRTLFFDFLPIELGTIRGLKTRIQLYTVPGQVFYNTTRKLVLKGADGVVFVADSQEEMIDHNIESFDNLQKNLKEHGMNLRNIPHIIQYNKRDLPNILSVDELNKKVNKYNVANFEAIATKGTGVYECLRDIIRQVINKIAQDYGKKDIKGPTTIPAQEVADKEKVPVATSPPGTTGATEKAAMDFPSAKEDELFSTEAQIDDKEEKWMNELEAGDIEPLQQQQAAPAFTEMEKPVPAFDPVEEETFQQSSTFDLEIDTTLGEEQGAMEEVNVPLEIPIDKNKNIVKLKINLSIKLKRK